MADISDRESSRGSGAIAALLPILVWILAIALLLYTNWQETTGETGERLGEAAKIMGWGAVWSFGLAVPAAVIAYVVGLGLRKEDGPRVTRFGFEEILAVILALAAFQGGLFAVDWLWDLDATSDWQVAPAYCLPIAAFMVARAGGDLVDAFVFTAFTTLSFFFAVYLGIQLAENVDGEIYQVGLIGGAVGSLMSLSAFGLIGQGYRDVTAILVAGVLLSLIGGAAFYLSEELNAEEEVFQLILYLPWQTVFSIFVLRGLNRS